MQSLPSPQATPHRGHDLVLLAAAADRDADPATRAAAMRQVESCAECATLAAELRSITAGLAGLPTARPVPRDMRITAEQAARIRRGGLLRRLLEPFGSSGLPALRPVAAVLTTLGLAGILLTALPLGLGSSAAIFGPLLPEAGAAAGGPSPARLAPASSSASAEQQGNDSKGVNGNPQESAGAAPGGAVFGPQVSTAPAPHDDSDRTASLAYDLSHGVPELSPLAWLSLALVIVGLSLFALRFLARRLA
jgi:hypothetical protein